MHKFFTRSLAASAMTIAFAGALLAAQATKPAAGSTGASASTQTSGKAHKGAAAKSASHSAKGTIEKFDAASNTLTVKTASGEENFTLGTSATLHHGSKSVKAEDLGGLTGDMVKVRYTEANGAKTATSVMVSSASAAKKAPKTPKSEPKK